jgi:hypothetical protein
MMIPFAVRWKFSQNGAVLGDRGGSALTVSGVESVHVESVQDRNASVSERQDLGV